VETTHLKLLLVLTLISSHAFAIESFKITILDRKVILESPEKTNSQYSVIVDNQSLSNIVGKFTGNGSDLKFVAVKAGLSKAVEFQYKKKHVVDFEIMSPGFQKLSLISGKKSYEIPPRQ
jgi:hypothetical protein